jgi:hypothetical protein
MAEKKGKKPIVARHENHLRDQVHLFSRRGNSPHILTPSSRKSGSSTADHRYACGRVCMPLKSYRNKIEQGEEDRDELEPNEEG